MKKKKLISAIVLFGLALSSCERCSNKDKEKEEEKHNTLKRSTTTSEGEIRGKEVNHVAQCIASTHKALKHASNVLTGKTTANMDAFDTAKEFTHSVNPANTPNIPPIAINFIAYYAAAYAEYAVARYINVNPSDLSLLAAYGGTNIINIKDEIRYFPQSSPYLEVANKFLSQLEGLEERVKALQ